MSKPRLPTNCAQHMMQTGSVLHQVNSQKSANVQDSVLSLLNRIPAELLDAAPVNIEDVAASLGVCQIIRKDIGCAGMLHPISAGRFEIFLNSSHSEARQRFSCAHEIAHILIPSDHPQLEAACDNLAAEILMPRALFSAKAASLSWKLASVPALSSSFLTSVEATAHRYVDTIDEPCTLFTWKLRADASPADITLCSFHRSHKARSIFIQLSGQTRRRNALSLSEYNNGPTHSVSGYDRIRVSRRGRDSFDTVFMETLSYGSKSNRRVMNAIFSGRRGTMHPHRPSANRVHSSETSVQAKRIGYG